MDKFWATFCIVFTFLAFFIAIATFVERGNRPHYAGKPYDPHMQVELFHQCLDAVRGTNPDDAITLCDLHAKQQATELYAADGGAP